MADIRGDSVTAREAINAANVTCEKVHGAVGSSDAVIGAQMTLAGSMYVMAGLAMVAESIDRLTEEQRRQRKARR